MEIFLKSWPKILASLPFQYLFIWFDDVDVIPKLSIFFTGIVYTTCLYHIISILLFAERFTILSYNILADTLARDHWDKLYFHIPRHFLDWEWRKRSILFELGLWSADVMCLQVIILIFFHYIFWLNTLKFNLSDVFW